MDFLQNNLAPATHAAYQSDLRMYEASGGSLPATSEQIATYLANQSRNLSAASLERRLAALSKAHDARGLPNPVRTDLVRATMRGIKRALGTAQRQAAPLLKEHLFEIMAKLGNRPKDIRDAAILMIGFSGALRRSELVALDCEDIQSVCQGLVLTIRRSKTDPVGKGRKIGIPYPTIKRDHLINWKAAVRKLCKNSDLGIFTLAVPFTGPLVGLEESGAEIAIFNIFGGSSSGKSFLQKIATTVYGNDDPQGSLVSFKITETGAEETLVNSNHLFLALDEEGLMEDEVVKCRRKFALSWTGGRSKTRSIRYGVTGRNTTFRVPIVASSNSTAEEVNRTRNDMPLAVRWIDIPATEDDDSGIFSKKFGMRLSAEQRSRFLKRLLKRCLKNQRSIGLKYLRILTAPEGRDRFLAATRKAAKRFVDRHKTGAAPYLIRILEKFALVFSVASCLPALGLVPWTSKEGERAVDGIFLRYLNHNAKVAGKDLAVLARLFSLTNSSAHFRRRDKIRNFKSFSGIGLKLVSQNRKLIGISGTSARTSSRVEAELGIKIAELKKLLMKHQLLVKDRRDKQTLSVAVADGSGGSSRFRFMPIDYLKLRAIARTFNTA